MEPANNNGGVGIIFRTFGIERYTLRLLSGYFALKLFGFRLTGEHQHFVETILGEKPSFLNSSRGTNIVCNLLIIVYFLHHH